MTKLTYSSHPNREAMRNEIDAYHRMHASLVSTYLGQYVAVFEGKDRRSRRGSGCPAQAHKDQLSKSNCTEPQGGN